MSEDILQSHCFQYAHNTYPHLRGLLFHVPNGGTRNKIEAVKMTAIGLIPGIPDLICVYHGIHAFELKTSKGVLSDAQKRIHELWKSQGIIVNIVRSFEQFKELIDDIANK